MILSLTLSRETGRILTEEKTIIEEARKAREKGVKFDVGHGVASFSYRVFEQALKGRI